MKQTIELYKENKFDRNSEAFNFFLSKPINLVLSNSRFDFVIRFKDLEFFDDDVEYLKRFYLGHEIPPRIQKLTQFYEVSMPRPITNLIPTEAYHIVQKRERRIIKMMINREKEIEENEKRNQQNSIINGEFEDQLLYDLDEDTPSEDDDSSEEGAKSYDSSIHDIYDDHLLVEEDAEHEFEEILDFQKIKRSELILDFKGETKKEKEREREKDKQKNEKIQKGNFANTKRETTGKHPKLDKYFDIENKKQSSGNLASPRKSFMEYYYSISPAKTTNLLNTLYKL